MLELASLRRLAFGPFSLSLADGACVSIEGGSGAGKSVLLRMVADLDPHDGDAILDGKPCSAMPGPAWRRLVTYVAATAVHRSKATLSAPARSASSVQPRARRRS